MLKLSLVTISDFFQSKSITLEKMRGRGFNGASTMSGNRTVVQTRLRLHAPSTIYRPVASRK